jgi:hypothetical protein
MRAELKKPEELKKRPAQPWKSGASAPRQRVEMIEALAAVVVFLFGAFFR